MDLIVALNPALSAADVAPHVPPYDCRQSASVQIRMLSGLNFINSPMVSFNCTFWLVPTELTLMTNSHFEGSEVEMAADLEAFTSCFGFTFSVTSP